MATSTTRVDLIRKPATPSSGVVVPGVDNTGRQVGIPAGSLTGPKGDRGDAGPKGDPGSPGSTGPKGDAGTSVKILGTRADAAALPSTGNAAGDGYLIAGRLFVYDGSAFNDVGTIQGPQGLQGAKGDAGVQGPTGPTGLQGPKGDLGPQGLQGLQGPKGDQGLQGLKGDQGLQGVKGDAGAAGPTGAQGASGPQGVQGPKGDQGLQGASGPAGPTGAQGIQGLTGAAGPAGPKGDPGAQGPAGPGADTSNLMPRPATAGIAVWNPTTATSTVIDPATVAYKTDLADVPVAWGDTSGQKQINTANGLSYYGRLVGNLVITGITGTVGSLGILISLRQDNVGGRTVAFPSSWLWNFGGVVQPMPLAPNARATYLVQQDGTDIVITQVGANAASVGMVQQYLAALSSSAAYAFEDDATTAAQALTDYGPNAWNGTIAGSPTVLAGPVANTDASDQSIAFTGAASQYVALDGHQLVQLNSSWSTVLRINAPAGADATNPPTIYMASSASSSVPYFSLTRATASPYSQMRVFWRDGGNNTLLDVTTTASSTGRFLNGTSHIVVVNYTVATAATSTTTGTGTLEVYIDGTRDINATVTIPVTTTTFVATLQTWGSFRRYDTTAAAVTAGASYTGLKLSSHYGATRPLTTQEIATLQTSGA